ncbi:MAG: hypothetical protein GY928_12055 [Colwellia sp.]|nr:hypothetical protein [Colwellia sp.]
MVKNGDTKEGKTDMILFPIILIIIMVSGMVWCWRSEIATWNSGIDADTGEPWIYFDSTFSGDRGYKSSKNYIWISYPYVDQPPKERNN